MGIAPAIRPAGAECESADDSSLDGATKADEAGVGEPPSSGNAGGSSRPVRSRPHAWQLVWPRKMSLAPQNWQVWSPAP